MSAVAVAVVGGGYWGTNLIRNLASLPTAHLAYVCDLDPACLEAVTRKYPSVQVTQSLADVLSDTSVRAVVVATPAESHRAVGQACLEAGKDVFVEKPLATCKEDAQAIVNLAGTMNRILMVGHLFMYDPSIRKTIELVQGGKVGDVRYITGVRTSMGGTARLDTNIVWDALIHDAYILTALEGRPPLRVQANGRGYLSELEDVVFATLDFGDKVLADCYASWYALEKARRLTIVGTEGILHLDEFADPKLIYYRRRYVRSTVEDLKGRPRWHWVDEGQEPQALENAEPLRIECEHFIECVRTCTQPNTNGQAALLAVKIIEACQSSLVADGAWVTVENGRG
jgi:UDP-2-acetamido-3-amino-2,3-dideoxy-glucuronate N-acetyltransferase